MINHNDARLETYSPNMFSNVCQLSTSRVQKYQSNMLQRNPWGEFSLKGVCGIPSHECKPVLKAPKILHFVCLLYGFSCAGFHYNKHDQTCMYVCATKNSKESGWFSATVYGCSVIVWGIPFWGVITPVSGRLTAIVRKRRTWVKSGRRARVAMTLDFSTLW